MGRFMNHKKWMAVIALAVTALILTHLPVSEADAAAAASDFQTQGSTLVKYRGTEERVTIPDTVEVVGESAFENNQKVQFVVIPKSVKRLDAYVFWGCNNLEEVVLGKGLTAVDEYSFAGCTGLKQITIPENIQSIDAQAFAGCVNLTDIYIPATVTGIAEDAFLNCDNVTIHADEGSVAAQFAQKLAEQKNRDPLKSFKHKIAFDPVVRDLDPLFDKGGLFFQLEGPFDHRIMLVDLLFQLIQAIGNQGGTFPVRQVGTGQRADHRKNGDDDPFGHAVTSVQP